MKYKAGQLENGQWAVFCNRKQFWTYTVTPDRRTAEISALEHSARWYRDQADKCHKELEKRDAIDHEDPYGYLA